MNVSNMFIIIPFSWHHSYVLLPFEGSAFMAPRIANDNCTRSTTMSSLTVGIVSDSVDIGSNTGLVVDLSDVGTRHCGHICTWFSFVKAELKNEGALIFGLLFWVYLYMEMGKCPYYFLYFMSIFFLFFLYFFFNLAFGLIFYKQFISSTVFDVLTTCTGP